jgi:hypothetical protein
MNPEYYKDWYLIQRLGTRTAPNSSKLGIDALVTHEYMGRSEFELGRVGEAWRALRNCAADIAVYTTPFKNRNNVPFYVLTEHQEGEEDIILQGVFGASNGYYDTLEPTRMCYALNPSVESDYRDATTAWLTLSKRPVFWSADKTLVFALLAELKRLPGKPEQFKLYDAVEFYHAGRRWCGEIRGIYETHMRVRLQNGNEQRVEYQYTLGPLVS